MIIKVKKYNLYGKNKETDVLHSQVACLYWKMQEEVERIAEITGYAPSTVKNYVRKYSDLVDKYDYYFNPDAPQGEKIVRTPLPYFKDEYPKVEIPETCGLYLVGSTHFDPILEITYYWIKVGMSVNLVKRLNSYRTENPMIFIADVYEDSPDLVRDNEFLCHVKLSDVAKAQAQGTNEWFLVDRETYLEICEKGFNYFF